MFCVSFFLRWVSRDLKIKNEYEKRRRDEKIKLYEMENQTEYDQTDGRIESIDPKIPFIYRLIEYWSFLENIAWIVILIMKKQIGYPENFLHGFCDFGGCDSAITKAIIIKLAVGILLLIGCKIVRDIFCMIWNS